MISEGIVDVDDVCDEVPERWSSSTSSSETEGVTRSAGIFCEAAVDGFRSCSTEGLCWMCVDCTIEASSDAILIDSG